MLVTNKILDIKGAGVSAQAEDSTVIIPNIYQPVFQPVLPISSIITSDPGTTMGESHIASAMVQQAAAQPFLDTILTRLAAGRWEIGLAYTMQSSATISMADLIAGSNIAMILAIGTGLGSIALLTMAVTTTANISLINLILNLPSDGWQIRMRNPQTQAGVTNWAFGTVRANKIT